MVRACAAGTPPLQNPGVQLGTVLGIVRHAGPGQGDHRCLARHLHDVGAWLEQLLAESTGKQWPRHRAGRCNEPLADVSFYGADRMFAYLAPEGRARPGAGDGHRRPGKGRPARGEGGIGQHAAARPDAFFLWEFATAVAGSIIGIDPFDQPDVEASKIETKKLTSAYNDSGSCRTRRPS